MRNPFSRSRVSYGAMRHTIGLSRQSGSVFLTIFFLGIFSVLLVLVIVYLLYIRSLPPISAIEDQSLPESTIIYDRRGNELYNLYTKEKRTYVDYTRISPYMVHAIVSTEDKNFFANNGVEVTSFFRSVYNYITGRANRVQGTSTISQQLIKQVFFSDERSIERKIKEGYLSYMLNERYSKEKILEIYLNKISFGSNAYGIEQASRTFFGKSASELGPLGSAILASLPKGPTYYSPYNARDRLMGDMAVSPVSDPTSRTSLSSPETKATYYPFITAFKSIIANLTIKRSGSQFAVCNINPLFVKDAKKVLGGCKTVDASDLQTFIGDIRIAYEHIVPANQKPDATLTGYVFEYTTGRKDFVLGRMLEDGYITPDEYKQSFIAGLEFTFQPYRENIKHPHFIFYIREYIESHYGTGFLDQGGLRIYTTIEPTLQDKAEELVRKQSAINTTKYGARDAALVSIDNTSGQILAMVGGVDYFDEKRDGAHVNVITSERQPGSSFKPIVYSLAFSKKPIGSKTPIYDVRTNFGNWTPDDYDLQFYGKMTVERALGYSRNIPAVKMLSMAGGESAVVDFARSLGILSLRHDVFYGAPLAIGTGEIKPIELAQAYSVFANGGYKIDATPILKIVDTRGNVLDSYMQSHGKYVLSDAAAYLISSILSNPANRPNSFWNNALTLVDGRPAAAKTGTSNKDESHGGVKKIVPRDLWTVGYTPQMTTVVWAGNINGNGTFTTCDGLNCAAPIWRQYMDFAHQGLPIMEFVRPDSIQTATISTISGKLAGTSTPENLRVSSIFAIAPTDYETNGKEIDIDTLCNGRVTPSTPSAAIRHGFLANPTPIIDGYDPAWMPPVTATIASLGLDDSQNSQFIYSYTDTECIRPKNTASGKTITLSTNLGTANAYTFGTNHIDIMYRGSFPVVRIQAWHNGVSFIDTVIDAMTSGTYSQDVRFDASFSGKQAIRIVATDKYGYTSEISIPITVVRNTTAPKIIITRPTDDGIIRMGVKDIYTLRFMVANLGEINATNLYLDGKLYRILGPGSSFDVSLNDTSDIPAGKHTLRIEAIDENFNKGMKEVIVTIDP